MSKRNCPGRSDRFIEVCLAVLEYSVREDGTQRRLIFMPLLHRPSYHHDSLVRNILGALVQMGILRIMRVTDLPLDFFDYRQVFEKWKELTPYHQRKTLKQCFCALSRMNVYQVLDPEQLKAWCDKPPIFEGTYAFELFVQEQASKST